MAKLGISTGINPNDGLGDTLLSGAIKINSNFNEIYSAIGNGVSITNSIEYATIAGFATAAGISSQVSSTININTTGIITASKIVAGGPSTFTEDLLVEGDLRVSGILTVGNSSVTINGNNNIINVGSGVTIEGNSGVIRATEFYADGVQVGVITAESIIYEGTVLENVWTSTAAGIHTLSNVGIGTTNSSSKLTVSGDVLISGATTTNILSIGSTEVISSSRQLRNIVSLDNITTQTIETAIANAPNTFTDLNITGITTLSTTTISQLRVSGVTTSTGGFVGNLTGTATTATNLNNQTASYYLDYDNFTNKPTGLSSFSNDVGFATETYVNNLVAISTFSGNYNDLTNTPTNLSEFSNDVGFITSFVDANYWTQTSAGIHTLSNVGIGTTNPTSALTVKGNTSLETLSVSGVSTLTTLSVGGTTGSDGQYLRSTGNGLTWENFTSLRNVYNYSATESQKEFIAAGINTGFVDVYLNGIRLDDANYSIIGIGVSLNVGAFDGDEVTVIGFNTVNASAGGGIGGGTGGGESYWEQTSAGIHTLSNVGIGTTNPTSALTVKGNTSLETLSVSGVSTFGNQVHIFNSSPSLKLQDSDGTEQWSNLNFDGSSNGFLNLDLRQFLNTPSFRIRSFAGGTDTATFLTVQGGSTSGSTFGFIGINSTSPTARLDVVGDAKVSGLTTTQNLFVSGVTTTQNLNVGTGSSIIHTNSYGVGIGTTADTNTIGIGGGPDKLLVNGRIRSFGTYSAGGKTPGISVGADRDIVKGLLTYDDGTWPSGPQAKGVYLTAVDESLTLRAGIGQIYSSIFINNNGVGIGTTNPTETLTVVGDVSISGVVTATSFSGSGANLTNLPASSITWQISSSGSTDYVFSGPGIVSGNTNDPILYLYRGFTYVFVNNTGSSHPFAIRESSGGSDYTPGVTGSQTGTQTFVVPMNAPSTLYYQCTIHSGMGNVINIV